MDVTKSPLSRSEYLLICEAGLLAPPVIVSKRSAACSAQRHLVLAASTVVAVGTKFGRCLSGGPGAAGGGMPDTRVPAPHPAPGGRGQLLPPAARALLVSRTRCRRCWRGCWGLNRRILGP